MHCKQVFVLSFGYRWPVWSYSHAMNTLSDFKRPFNSMAFEWEYWEYPLPPGRIRKVCKALYTRKQYTWQRNHKSIVLKQWSTIYNLFASFNLWHVRNQPLTDYVTNTHFCQRFRNLLETLDHFERKKQNVLPEMLVNIYYKLQERDLRARHLPSLLIMITVLS